MYGSTEAGGADHARPARRHARAAAELRRAAVSRHQGQDPRPRDRRAELPAGPAGPDRGQGLVAVPGLPQGLRRSPRRGRLPAHRRRRLAGRHRTVVPRRRRLRQLGFRPLEDRGAERDGRARASRGPGPGRRPAAPRGRARGDRRVRRGPDGGRDGRAVRRRRAPRSATRGAPRSSPRSRRRRTAELAKLRAGTILVGFLNPLGDPDGPEGDRRDRRDRAGDGADPAHQPRAVDGRAVLAGDGERLPGGADRLDRARALLPDVHDRGGHGPARAGARAGRGRRGAAGDRDRAPARRGRHRRSTSAARSRSRSSRWARASSRSKGSATRRPRAATRASSRRRSSRSSATR